MMQLEYEVSYDKHYQDYEYSFMLVRKDSVKGGLETWMNRQTPSFVADNVSGVVGMTVIGGRMDYNVVLIDENGNQDEKGHSLPIITIEPQALDIFPFELIEGQRVDFDQPNSAVISQELSKRLFQDKSPIGRRFTNRATEYTICGV